MEFSELKSKYKSYFCVLEVICTISKIRRYASKNRQYLK